MVQLFGALIVVFAGVGTGRLLSHNLRSRPDQLRAMRVMLQHLRTEMEYGLTPMPELMARMAEQHDEPIRSFAATTASELSRGRPVREAWALGLEKVYPSTGLTRADMEPLLTLGRALGASHVDDQVRHIELATGRIEYNLERALQERDTNAKLYMYLGVITALGIVVLSL